MYHQTPILSDYPCYITGGGIAITVVRAAILPDVTIVVLVRRLHIPLIETLEHYSLFIFFFPGRLSLLTTGPQFITSTLIYQSQKLQ